MKKNQTKTFLKKVWRFIWEDDSIWSWIVNVILAFVLIKYIVYPGLGFMLNTGYPIVAVVSGSMKHNGNFNSWWVSQGEWYVERDITQEQFSGFDFDNGFNKGDIMILYGKEADRIEIGDVVVFRSRRPDPIIHRVVKKWEVDGEYYFQTKGDNNADSIRSINLDETNISQEQLLGKAAVRIPLLGYIKIWFVELINLFIR